MAGYTRQWYEISESAMSNPTYTTELVNRRTGAATTADDVDDTCWLMGCL